ncbi:MAG: SDR family oxidoreductase [Desulfobacteraceae bacterium]|jgi:NAD(P)-dependent dehydrogenase (short-subunit alcohol dehydrogenase family)
MNDLKDKIAIVTGGASGIGRELCIELGRRGAVVVVADIMQDGAQEVASTITTAGGQAVAALLDVSREQDVRKLIDETTREHGRLDYMFNNAGVAVSGDARDMTIEHWRRVFDVNLWGVVYGTNAAYSIMVKQGFGHIVNVSSLSGLIGYPTNIPYGTTKYGVVGLSNSLRVEAADLGVKVSVVCPGFVQTSIWENATLLNASREDVLAQIPFKMMEVSKAAKATLRGVARNRAIIIFPFHARLLWWLNRLHPTILTPIGRKMVKNFRAIRQEPRPAIEENEM